MLCAVCFSMYGTSVWEHEPSHLVASEAVTVVGGMAVCEEHFQYTPSDELNLGRINTRDGRPVERFG